MPDNSWPSCVHRVLVDHNFNEGIIRGFLRRRPDEIDIVLLRSRGYEREPDDRVLDLALEEDRTLLTHDLKTLHSLAISRIASGRPCPRVVVVPWNLPIGPAIDELEVVLLLASDGDWEAGPFVLPL
ncbi:MAG TPA: DUF5615 family PIN-like protein [Tepidiformaceae bacterium]|nr:DUF5615 family PIN-like protein [Tepidiformaceae bacterium]